MRNLRFFRNWRLEAYDDYAPTEHTVILVGFEVRRSFPADDPEYPGYGGAVGLVFLNWWVGLFKFKA